MTSPLPPWNRKAESLGEYLNRLQRENREALKAALAKQEATIDKR